MAYRLELPPNSRLHPVFHVSQLKKQLGAADCTVVELPTVTEEGTVTLEPNRIVDFRWVKSGKKVLQEALVQRTGTSVEDATWERFADLQHQFPYLNLEDKIHLQGEGNVMSQTKLEQPNHVDHTIEVAQLK